MARREARLRATKRPQSADHYSFWEAYVSLRTGFRGKPVGTDPEVEASEMLKVELHTHTADDPVDAIPHTTLGLIDHAAALGYDALAITLHEHQLDLRRFTPYAAERGIVLIPGVERTVEGRHVLLLNYTSGTEQVRSFADLAALTQRASGLVIAPHPFFPARAC